MPNLGSALKILRVNLFLSRAHSHHDEQCRILFRTKIRRKYKCRLLSVYKRKENGTTDVVNIIPEGSRGIYFCDHANGTLDYTCAREAANQLNLSWRKMRALCNYKRVL